MQLSFRDDDQDVLFVVSDFPSAYQKALENCAYTLAGGVYIKRFPRDTKNIDVIKANFERYAADMFEQQLCTDNPWEDALLAFVERVEDKDIDWWLTGSCATRLRGVAIKPHDIDIMVNSKDIDAINDIFADHMVEPICTTNGWVVKHFGVLFMNAKVDLAFDPEDFVDSPYPADFGPFAMKNLEEISWRGKRIRVPPLALQLQVNKRRGRHDRAKAIADHMCIQKA